MFSKPSISSKPTSFGAVFYWGILHHTLVMINKYTILIQLVRPQVKIYFTIEFSLKFIPTLVFKLVLIITQVIMIMNGASLISFRVFVTFPSDHSDLTFIHKFNRNGHHHHQFYQKHS